jgi:hypothetical protein
VLDPGRGRTKKGYFGAVAICVEIWFGDVSDA